MEDTVSDQTMTEDQPEEGVTEEERVAKRRAQQGQLPKTNAGTPDWVKIPSNLALPPEGEIVFVRFRPEWTPYPSKGERQAIIWPLTVKDKKLAASRIADMTEANLTVALYQQQIRAVDGLRADWTVGDSNVEQFWNEIGEKCRGFIGSIFVQLHVADPEMTADFFGNCIAVRRVVASG
jgi:hypothetical protein